MSCKCGKPTCSACTDPMNVLFPGARVQEGASCRPSKCTSVPLTPEPFYHQAPSCAENHNDTVYINQYSATLRVADTWNIPDCGGSAILTIKGLKNFAIGSYIWNQRYGYFRGISLDPEIGALTITNDCTVGNGAIGTQVPACTDFLVTDPPSADGSGITPNTPYLKADFTAPLVGAGIDITLTSVAGLSIGKSVQIGSGTYLLNAIRNQAVVNISNIGSGIDPGTTVYANNSAGQLQYPVVLIDTNPCTNTPVIAGQILVCADGNTQPLAGPSAGSVPTLIDPATNTVEFRVLDVPTRTCSALTADLVLTNGVSAYTLIIGDTTQMTVGDVLQLGTRTDRFTITSIPSSTILEGTLSPTPSIIAVVEAGTSICEVDCCESLQTQMNTANSNISALQAFLANAQSNLYFIDAVSRFYNVPIPEVPYAVLIEAGLNVVTAPVDHDMHFIAVLDVQVLPNHDSGAGSGAALGLMTHEIEVVWSNLPPPRGRGKTVFTDFGYDGFTMSPPPYYPTDFASFAPIWSYLTPFGGGAPLYPSIWHSNQVVVYSGGIFAGQSIGLQAFYKCIVGDLNGPSVINNTTIYLSGFIVGVPVF